MFKFTIRELLLLTLVVGLGVGWWLDHTKQRLLAERANASATRFKHALCYAIEAVEGSGYRIEGPGIQKEFDEARGSITFTGRGPILLKTH